MISMYVGGGHILYMARRKLAGTTYCTYIHADRKTDVLMPTELREEMFMT